MRTLGLLAVIFLFALQAQTEVLRETADEFPAQDEPGAEDQDVPMPFAEEESSFQDASGLLRNTTCVCRIIFCRFGEHRHGICRRNGFRRIRCCR